MVYQSYKVSKYVGERKNKCENNQVCRKDKIKHWFLRVF